MDLTRIATSRTAPIAFEQWYTVRRGGGAFRVAIGVTCAGSYQAFARTGRGGVSDSTFYRRKGDLIRALLDDTVCWLPAKLTAQEA